MQWALNLSHGQSACEDCKDCCKINFNNKHNTVQSLSQVVHSMWQWLFTLLRTALILFENLAVLTKIFSPTFANIAF